jgi:large subunit ribosomal protein L6
MASTNIEKESRVGKAPIPVPNGVSVEIKASSVTLKGPKGELKLTVDDTVELKKDGDIVTVHPKKGSGTRGLQFQGTTRALVRNAVVGVSEGYKTSLDLYGVGYRAELNGQNVTLSLGLSHQVKYELPAGVKARVETIDEAGVKRPRLHLESHNKELIGRVAARIKSFRPPEPYKGKGVRFTGERIRQKAGKAGAK